MATYSVIYNPLSNNCAGEQGAKELSELLSSDTLNYTDITEITDYKTLFSSHPDDENYIISGGDGTLNRFVNDVFASGAAMPKHVYYFPSGSGNDFYKDISKDGAKALTELSPYLKDLPTVEINGKTSYFLNGIGFGIDGYCCEEADRQRARSNKKINYTLIALKGLFGKYSPRHAKVTIDGVRHVLPYVWLAPTMNGKYFGGGMMPAPLQDRLNPERKITFMSYFDKRRLRTLSHFPTLFKGTFTKFEGHVLMQAGYDITVEFDRPCALQIDGETVLNVTKYRCRSAALNK